MQQSNPHVYTELLKRSFAANAQRPCFHIKRNGDYQSWTYADVHRDLNRLVSVLRDLGLKKGVNGAVIGENCPEWVMAHHGIFLTGACAVPIDPNLPESEIRSIVSYTESKIVFCSPAFLPLFSTLRKELPFLRTIVCLDPTSEDSSYRFDRFISVGDGSDDALEGSFAPDDPISIIFTSGTTGTPKGVVLSQKNFTGAPVHGVPRMNVSADDTMVSILPLHHVFGFAACVAATLPTGIDVVFVPQIKGPLILEALNDKKVSILPAVPQMLELLYANIERKVAEKGLTIQTLFKVLRGVSVSAGAVFGAGLRRKLYKTVHEGFGGHLRLIISGGSSLKKKYFDGFRLMGFDIVEGYGLTETFGPITICPHTKPKQSSVGPVFPENEMKIVAPNQDGIGEVYFRGITVFPGYYKNPDATAQAFDNEGWFTTGDLGRIDKDGFLFLTGRLKDVIVLSSGKNVYPDEIEERFLVSGQIEELGVFGTLDAGEEVVTALVVPSKELRRAHPPAKASEMIGKEIARIGSSLPSYMRISRFLVTYQQLPRTSTKKLKKPQIKAMYEEIRGSSRPMETPRENLSFLETQLMASEEYRALVDYIVQLVPGTRKGSITPRTHLEIDLGLDSLKSLDLISMIEERFKCEVPPETLTKLETVGDAALAARELRGTLKPSSPQKTSPNQHSGADNPPKDNGRTLFRIGAPITQGLSKAVWGLSVKGVEHTRAESPIIFAANHESVVDIAWLLGALPWKVRKKTFATGKVEITTTPLLSSLSKMANMIPVERDGDVTAALNTARAVLRASKNLIVFPEGTRTRTGEMGAFKSGIGTLMLETGAAIVPVRIRNSGELWPPEQSIRLLAGHKQKPSLTFGPPVTLDELIESRLVPQKPTADSIASAIRDKIASM